MRTYFCKKLTFYEKIFSALAILFCTSLSINAIDVDLEKLEPGLDPFPEDRSLTTVTASIDGQVLTVQFSELTSSQIVVKDSANLTVFNQSYVSAYSAQANLTSLAPGCYTLHIYAMGDWWYGHFEIE